jgi:hypothetical protein
MVGYHLEPEAVFGFRGTRYAGVSRALFELVSHCAARLARLPRNTNF